MEILSPVHGKITYSEDEILKFEKAIPGFEEIEKYIIRDIDEESSFKILQAIDNPNISFIIVSPFDVEEEYEIELNDEIIKRLEIEKSEDVILYSLVTLNSNPDKITVNLKAPIIINILSNKGEQFIVDKEKYKIKHPLMKG